MTPLPSTMIYDMQLPRLAPRTQPASVEAVKGLARFYRCAPDRLDPTHIHHDLHHLLVERGLAWSTCNQVACGLQFFYTKTRSWTDVKRNLPPRTARPPLPHVFRVDQLERLFPHATPPPKPRPAHDYICCGLAGQ